MNYFEYFPVGPQEVAWSFCVTSVGHVRVKPGDAYPQPLHPRGHYFTWESGRSLPALQLVAISSGRGRLEFSDARHDVASGSIFVLPPGCWHRYRPDPDTGWVEDWIELRGATVDAWMSAGLIESSLVKIEPKHPAWRWYAEIHRLCRAHRPGFRPTAAGLAMALVAQVVGGEGPGGPAGLTRRARELLLAGHDVASVAERLGVSYPTLYRHFKQSTGLGPKEYAREIRLARAEDLVTGTRMSIKEIADRLGFHSASHLSAEFKKAKGIAPALARKKPGP